MHDSIRVPAGSHETELELKRSRFIARAEPAADPKNARDLIAERKREHPSASHVAYAFIIGDGSSETSGMSDDGEPKGTAGRPIMEVLKGRGIRNVLVTVTRYFGGTKLGTGGLVGAYGDAAKHVLDGLPVKELLPTSRFNLELPYDLYEQAKKILSASQAVLLSEEFGETVLLQGDIPDRAVGECAERIRDASCGRVELRVQLT